MTDQPSVVERLLRTWRTGTPDLSEFVAAQGELSKHELVALVAEDQRQRWHRGERVPVEEYASQFPQLSGDSMMDAIYTEFMLREDLGESPEEADYRERFPEHAESITRQLQLHRALTASTIEDSGFLPPARTEPDPVPSPVAAPEIEGFEIQSVAGRGGMGVVYRARDTQLNRIVAIKTLKAGGSAGPDETARLIVEAESAARLQHPGVVQVYHVGRLEDTPYLVMQFVAGGTLADELRSGPLSVQRSVEVAVQITDAVRDAHEHAIIHRDIKPGNVLVDETGRVRITDFGLSRHIDSALTVEAADRIVGTPAYMAPEQARGGDVRQLADIYSVGAVLYEMLTGRPPFQAASAWDVVCQILTHEPPRLRELNSALPRDLETICERCLEKNPERRYASAVDLLTDLRNFTDGRPIQARPVGSLTRLSRWARRNPRLAGLSGLVLALVVILSVVITVAGVRIRDARASAGKSQVEAVQARVDALLLAAPDAVPFAVRDLQPFQESAAPLLRAALSSTSTEPSGRLQAACALASFGSPERDVVIESVGAVPASPGALANIVRALEQDDTTRALEDLARVADAGDQETRIRAAVVALFLGDTRPVAAVVSDRTSPELRSAFIQRFATWHCRPHQLADLLAQLNEPDLRSALVVSIGTLDAMTIPRSAREDLIKALQALYVAAEHGGTHSACRWTLSRWNAAVPDVTEARSGWFRGSQGQVMVRIDAGNFLMGSQEFHRAENQPRHEVTHTRAFYLSDAEVTARQFQEFVDETGESLSEKAGHPDSVVSPTAGHPVQSITFDDAIRFCNWLSEREDRTPCYRLQDGSWNCDFRVNGYRLPTEAEWEYACRAGTKSRFHFGNDDALLPEYGRTSNNRKLNALPARSLLPNTWGLFDMHGNVWEWCWDVYADLSSEPEVDPRGPSDRTLPERVIRGGGIDSRSGDPDSASRGRLKREWHAWNLGFRIACTER